MNWFVVLGAIALVVGACSMFTLFIGGALSDSTKAKIRDAEARGYRKAELDIGWQHAFADFEAKVLERQTLAALDECLSIVRGWSA